jgi:hypothetical protein
MLTNCAQKIRAKARHIQAITALHFADLSSRSHQLQIRTCGSGVWMSTPWVSPSPRKQNENCRTKDKVAEQSERHREGSDESHLLQSDQGADHHRGESDYEHIGGEAGWTARSLQHRAHGAFRVRPGKDSVADPHR